MKFIKFFIIALIIGLISGTSSYADTISRVQIIKPTLLGGWADFDDTYDRSIKAYKDLNGIVHLEGMAKGGALKQAIIKLPPGFRPSTSKNFSVVSNDNFGRISIFGINNPVDDRAGEVWLMVGSNEWVSLDGISFVAAEESDYRERLYTATQITKIDGLYFIVDCWNHRIIYSDDINKPIKQWNTLTDDISGPHSIDSNGTLYVTEDTGRNKVLVFKKVGNRFEKIQTINDVGTRPHRTRYDPDTNKFYVIAGNSQEIFSFTPNEDGLTLDYKKKLTYLDSTYIRSFSIIDGKMVFVSGVGLNPGKITVANYTDESFSIANQYNVPKGHENGNDIIKINNKYYITDLNGIIRVNSLSDLETGNYEELNTTLKIKGNPYYLSVIDGRVYIPEIYPYTQIKSFSLIGDTISDVRVNVDVGKPNNAEKERLKVFSEG